jgi:hypothetical protein
MASASGDPLAGVKPAPDACRGCRCAGHDMAQGDQARSPQHPPRTRIILPGAGTGAFAAGSGRNAFTIKNPADPALATPRNLGTDAGTVNGQQASTALTLTRRDGPDVVHAGLAGSIREVAGASLRTPCPGPRSFRQEGPSPLPAERTGLGGYLLAWTVVLSVCGGLLGLALLPPLGGAVPRWSILAYGVGCALLALLALLLSRLWAGSPGRGVPPSLDPPCTLEPASAHSIAPTTNTVMPLTTMRLRPQMSASLPAGSRVTVTVVRYATIERRARRYSSSGRIAVVATIGEGLCVG